MNNKIILITEERRNRKSTSKKTAKLIAKLFYTAETKKLELLSDDIAADKEYKRAIALLDFEIADLNSY